MVGNGSEKDLIISLSFSLSFEVEYDSFIKIHENLDLKGYLYGSPTRLK